MEKAMKNFANGINETSVVTGAEPTGDVKVF